MSVTTIEGLLFRSYLSGYNLSFLHRCIKVNDEDLKNDHHRKAALSTSDFDFERKIDRAKRLTESFIWFCEKNNVSILCFTDENYPSELLKIKDFPPLLFLKGRLAEIKSAAIIGTRETSPLAQSKTAYVTHCFGDHGYGIISGLAQGVDTLSHQSAIENNYYTAAILPTAFDRIYPEENIPLANKILDKGGVLITEQAPNYAPVANPFVLRNRIQAALSDYVVPIEMGKDSGASHTLQYAVRYGRIVILCMPNTFEIDHFLPQYEGLIISAKKYRAKTHTKVITVRKKEDIPLLLSQFHAENKPGPLNLFN